MLADLRQSARQLRKSPGFTLTAIVTLALAIGANAVVFSVLNALLLRPLNVPRSQNLYMIERTGSPFNSYPDYLALRDRNHTFENMAAYYIMGPVGLDTGGNPMTVWPYEASGNYFDALDVHPYLGRFFHGSDEHGLNSAPYAVVSYAYWHSHFQDDPGVVGRTVQINKHPFTILGVAPRDFRGTELFLSPDLWLPMVDHGEFDPADDLRDPSFRFAWVVGRLKPGITPAQATADLASVASYLAKTYPRKDDGGKFSLSRPGLVGNMLGQPAREFMSGLMLLTGLILLAACANLGSLFAARAADRAREIALRLALGSRRGLILRQLLTEAILVSLAGGAIGLTGGKIILRWLSTWQPIPDMPVNVPVNPDVNTYVVALLLALVSGLLFGIVPVRLVMNADPYQTIRSGSMGVHGGRRFSARDLLLAAQIAICAVLVTSSFVAVRGLVRSMHSTFGFRPNSVMLLDTHLSMAGYTGDSATAMQRKMLDGASAIPGVTVAGITDRVPLGLNWNSAVVFTDTTTDYRPSNATGDAWEMSVSPQYFDAAGTAMLSGRTFTWHDDSKAPAVAVVNQEFARKVFGSVEKAIGGHYKMEQGKQIEVVGVVEDGKYRTLTEDRRPAMFLPILQQPDPDSVLVLRTSRDTKELTAALQQMMRALDPALPFTVRTWSRDLDWPLFAPRIATIALGVLGILGAMLAMTGIFGMAAYVVSKRLRELGIRVALGARGKEVLSAAVGRVFQLLAVGSVAGLMLGLLAARVLSHIVYQATPKDPAVLGGVILAMLVLGLVAAWIPAQRALAVDPVILLREE